MKLALPLYRLSLRLLPRDLSDDFGDDMVQLFRDEWRATTNPLARAGLLAAALGDVVRQSADLRPGRTNHRRSAMSNFPQDFRHGLRLLRRYPATAIVAIATLALGIGANTAIFSVVDAVLLRALPYPHPDQLVMIHESRPAEGVTRNSVSPADFLDWRAMGQSFSAMAGFTGGAVFLSGVGEPVQLPTGVASAGFFDVLGVQPFMGRGFRLEEEVRGKHRVAVLTYGLWQRQFGADPNIIGRMITLTGNPTEVVGVLPQSFAFFDPTLELFVPLAFGPTVPRASHALEVFARMKPGVTLAQAHAEMENIGKNLEAKYQDSNRGHGANVAAMQSDMAASVSKSLVLLSVAVGLVLLLASVNVANLMLVRSVRREREMGVRAALGADRWRLITQSFAECFAVAAAGGVLGVGLAAALIRLLPAVLPEQLSIVRTDALHLDLRVLAAAGALTIATSFVFGLLPALRASRGDVVEALKQGGRGAASVSRRVRVALVVSEVTLASLTLVGAGLIVRSFSAMQAQPLGIDPHGRIALELAAPAAMYTTEEARRDAMLELERRLAAIPGVTSVGGIDMLPLSGEDGRRGVIVEGREPVPDSPTRMHPRVVTPTYFRTAGMTLLGGRGFTNEDTATTPLVSVINNNAAAKYWPGQNAIGKRWSFVSAEPRWITVVGVAADVRHWGLSSPVNPMVFVPETQLISGALTFVAKTDLSPTVFGAAARDAVHAFDPNLPVGNLRTMADVVAQSLRPARAITLLMSAFGVLALLLAAIGIYGVMSQLVESRVHEIGVRVALGARPSHVLGQFLVGCTYQTVTGIAIGGAAGVYLISAAQILFGISAWDPATLTVVAATILGASLMACLIPALRALRVDPVTAIRD